MISRSWGLEDSETISGVTHWNFSGYVDGEATIILTAETREEAWEKLDKLVGYSSEIIKKLNEDGKIIVSLEEYGIIKDKIPSDSIVVIGSSTVHIELNIPE